MDGSTLEKAGEIQKLSPELEVRGPGSTCVSASALVFLHILSFNTLGTLWLSCEYEETEGQKCLRSQS